MVTIALTAAGVVVAGYLTAVALDPSRPLACGPLGDCHAVQSSEYAHVAGVPVAALGLAMYLALFALAVARWYTRDRSRAYLLASAAFALALGGVVYSIYLTFLELFVIHAICPWCVTSAVLVCITFALNVHDLVVTGRQDPPS